MNSTQPDYGAAGRLGLGTPQGNPTVEAEFRRLMPIDVEYYTVRLTSQSDDPHTRLLEYIQHLPEFVARYAKLRLDGFMFACTGSSYLLTGDVGRRYADAAAEILGAPVILAADAIAHWLERNAAASIVLLSPYPDWLNKPAVNYWTQRGYEVRACAQVDIGSSDTYGIYEQQTGDALSAAAKLLDTPADAFVITGTGMPGLPLIKRLRAEGRPVVSSNVALANAGLELLGVEPVPESDWHVPD